MTLASMVRLIFPAETVFASPELVDNLQRLVMRFQIPQTVRRSSKSAVCPLRHQHRIHYINAGMVTPLCE